MYIKIDANEFEYTTSDKIAELILTITDPDGNEVTSLSGLTYTTVTDGEGNTVSGFDITSKFGLITIASECLIESTGSNTQKWNIEVTLVNLDSNQSENAGASFSASIVIQSNVYGYNVLQAVGFNYSGEFWEYKGSYTTRITKIVFDDTGSTISDYEEVYDITDYSSYCTYDGNEVYNFDSWNTSGVTKESCNTVYKVTDDDYTGYFDDSYTSYITEYGSAIWDSDDNVCKTSDGNEVYTWYYWNSPTEDECSGTVYYESYSSKYYVGIEYVGSGEWIESVSSIYAYLVNNGDSTYTVYIESDLPIYGNSDMSWWFYFFYYLESIEGLEKLNTSIVKNMSYMFSHCLYLEELDLGNFDTSNVTNMEGMFSESIKLTSLDLSSFNTSNVTNMRYMFGIDSTSQLMNLKTITFGGEWDTSNVTDMSYMFQGCVYLTSLNLSNFDTSNVTDMSYMFQRCVYLTSLNLSNFDTSNVTDMSYMFSNCNSLEYLDLSNADFSNVTTKNSMFYNVPSSITVTVKDSDAYDFITARLLEYNGGTVVIA